MTNDTDYPSITTSKRGKALIHDPLLNKGSAFSTKERDELGLHGLLPPQQNTLAQQARRAHNSLLRLTEPLDKYVGFSALQDRNEHLFYRILMDHMTEYMPIVYTPTVGLATQNFSHVFQRGRGIWINPSMRGKIADVLKAAIGEVDIKLIVATDNESILGIGDQGAGGMAISVGKLALYVAGAGINPAETLPISLDVGTNNESLLEDDLYLGWPERRLTGTDYDEFIAEFVEAVRKLYPNALLQWEDFRKDNALQILETHRQDILSFNDDIQGTGAVALAGVLSGLRIAGGTLPEQRIVIHGAGAAGLGIARQIKAALAEAGLAPAEIHQCLAVLDSRGLLVDDKPFKDAYKSELAWEKSLADKYGLSDPDARQLEDVVQKYKPTVLIGTSGQAGAFTENIAKTMLAATARPIILPFSNPTDRAEATPSDLLHWTDGKALVAAGSPFEPVGYAGRIYKIGQGNNVFIFPGLGLGALLANSSVVTDEMVSAASLAAANSMTEQELADGMLFPEISRLRDVTKQVAHAVASKAIDDGYANATKDDVEDRLENQLWQPDYPEIKAE
jgi:malate dehydrogenase (oxaloacetate-decarboxylating)